MVLAVGDQLMYPSVNVLELKLTVCAFRLTAPPRMTHGTIAEPINLIGFLIFSFIMFKGIDSRSLLPFDEL